MSDLPALEDAAPELLDPAPADVSPVFVELICADTDLLRAEFEALMAANYPSSDARSRLRPPRPNRPSRIDCALQAPRRIFSSRSESLPQLVDRTDWTDDVRAARERSPPS
jgi:hypothetical protein